MKAKLLRKVRKRYKILKIIDEYHTIDLFMSEKYYRDYVIIKRTNNKNEALFFYRQNIIKYAKEIFIKPKIIRQ